MVEDYVVELGERAPKALEGHGIGWGPETGEQINELYGPISIEEAGERVGEEAAKIEPSSGT